MRQLILFLVISSVPCVSAAQDEQVPSRDYVRVYHTSPCCAHPLYGTLMSVNADSLVLRDARTGGLLTLPRNLVSSVERRTVAGSHAWSYGSLGLVGGFAIGAIVGYTRTKCPNEDSCFRSVIAAVDGSIGALVGGLVGKNIGETKPLELWEPVALP